MTLGIIDHQARERLFDMVDASGLDREWVSNHSLDYFKGNAHIGRWQGYVNDRRWMDLADKFSADR